MMTGLEWTAGLSPSMVPALVFSRRARRALKGMVVLRRAYEHVLVMAVLEGSGPQRALYYESYVDALEILGARAALIARTL